MSESDLSVEEIMRRRRHAQRAQFAHHSDNDLRADLRELRESRDALSPHGEDDIKRAKIHRQIAEIRSEQHRRDIERAEAQDAVWQAQREEEDLMALTDEELAQHRRLWRRTAAVLAPSRHVDQLHWAQARVDAIESELARREADRV